MDLLINLKQRVLFLVFIFSSVFVLSQTNRVLVSVNWPSNSFQNKVEVYDPANNLLISICNEDLCYQTSGSNTKYYATYDLGCLAIAQTLPDYYIKIYNANNTAWSGAASVTVDVAGTTVINDSGASASSAGFQVDFSVDNTTNTCSQPDTDKDGVIDVIDQDDDNDGILDVYEGLAINDFNCGIPELSFRNYVIDNGGTAGAVGTIYRFDNSAVGLDVLVEIEEIDPGATLTYIDANSTAGIEDYLQTRIDYVDSVGSTLGIKFKFTIVLDDTDIPATTISRIGGTSWDVDGRPNERESIRYYNPSAYGSDNPTTLTTQTETDGVSIVADYIDYPNFNDSPLLRSYFQFDTNTFHIKMQLTNDISLSSARLYTMSFSQCDIFEYKAPSLTILNGNDTDTDGLNDNVDLDSDNDGIPDNIEGQLTNSYLTPTITLDATGFPVKDSDGVVLGVDPVTGIDDSYVAGLAIIDTDGDNIPDFIDDDSDNDGTPDIEENGMPTNSLDLNCDPTCDTDTDSDGLFDPFEGSLGTTPLLDPYDVNDDINDPTDLSVLPDTDGDLALGGDLDYRDAIDVYYESATIDFDGDDDYIDSEPILGGLENASLMAWIKLDSSFANEGFVIGQDNFNLYISTNKTLVAVANGTSTELTTPVLSTDTWVHIAAVYANGDLKIYINGQEEANPSTTGSLNASTDNFTIGKNPNDSQLFRGAIDEVRVFDVALTEDQLQQIVYQEIELNGSNVKGTIVPLDIADFTSSANLLWTNLQAYYPMTQITSGRTLDFSDKGRTAILHNITTVQPQTAPMPYETHDGTTDWILPTTWLNGDVWDIEDATTKPWAIYQIHNNVSVSSSVYSYGLFIDDGITLTVNGDNEINNGWHFQLNGTLDLLGDSQLVQTTNSKLITDADGKILRRQEGNLNYYRYNYWSSPVGAPAETSNTNTAFNIDMIKDGTEADILFTDAYNETNKISRYWLYTFQNGLTYFDWVSINESTDISAGVGYTQKGIQNANGNQQYIFEGKPHNGTILIAATDVPNDDIGIGESVKDQTLTTTLIGNPYPSAIDARLFIADNAGIIEDKPPITEGTILLWEQWAGNSHYLAEYQGGYGFINTWTTARAYQHEDIPLAIGLEDEGIKRPTFYIPVGQGFFVEVINDGDIEFNNAQRVFVKESDVMVDQDNGAYANNGSSFFRTSNSESTGSTESTESAESTLSDFQILRLEFGVSSGASRSFVLGFSEDATDGLDYGLDGGLITDPPADDMGSLLNGQQYVIQAFAPITPDKVVDLVLNASGNFTYTLKSTEISNFPVTQELFLRDNLTNVYYDLRSEQPYSFTSDAGYFTDRFDVIFQSGDTLSNQEFNNLNTLIYVNQSEHTLHVSNLANKSKQINIANMLGQIVKTFNNLDNMDLQNGLDISNLSNGVYVVSVQTENDQQIDKKVIIN